MGGGAMPEQGGGGKRKKSLDAVINVVPAIDLLSCLITFLLYTAVWTQISRLQVQQFGSGAPEPQPTEQQKQMIVTLAIGERGMNLTTTSGLAFEIPLDRTAGAVKQDYRSLSERLKQLRADYPETAAITVSAEDTVPYGDLVEVIDTCIGQGLTAVSVSGA
ncbi:ExbD/TolR family protein [Anaeromyxobacter oryzae]|uniref:Biopolymer transporter ExbD n=1 Tax=Anaeromyxobacter oryzae TaxID=2918170 RepID=A0ABN6MT26_9BACT|nr:biopolymer transporter ExbD [Anaeromyxobacter oryzae]BDG03460.1 hypothetical protein AMOR_24560 [Anaeromyxobacter oryzae]